jgi:hypothetical protein
MGVWAFGFLVVLVVLVAIASSPWFGAAPEWCC